MAGQDWSEQDLTDREVVERFSKLSTEKEYTQVWLQYNKLERVPDFTKYRQFGRLEVLFLSGNNIQRVEGQRLPHTVRELHMSGNNIIELGDLSECTNLEVLWLLNNQLTEVNAQKLPLDITRVVIQNNKITHVGDFSHHHRLEYLNLIDNPISSIDRRNTNLSGWYISILGEEFFKTEEGYQFVRENGLDTEYLVQPPREVFERGYVAVRSYYGDIRLSKTVRNSRKRVVLLGLTEAGKSSMAESLIAGKGILINIKDRTRVVDIKLLHITEDDLIHLYDHGGHDVYNIASPLFISKECLIFVVHDICKVKSDEVEKTIGVLRQALHQYPENEMQLILTHIDCLNKDEVSQNKDVIIDAIQNYLGEEIDNLDRVLNSNQSDAENQDLIDDTQQLRGHFLRQRKALTSCYPVSSANYSGMDDLQALLKYMAKQKRTTVPESWVKFYKAIIENKKQYLTLDDIQQLYDTSKNVPLYIQYNFLEPSPISSSDSGALVPLHYFADTNLVLHYDNNPFLKDYVFHNIDFLIDVMKSVFNHDISEVVNYEMDRHLQSLFKKGECDLAVKQYQTEGLLGRKLLQFLWNQYGLKIENEEILLQLLHSFNMCYNISADKENELQFFPWFVESQKCPQHVDTDNLMIFDREHASVHFQCEFFNRIPLNVFEMLCVCLQRKATNESHYMGDRRAWRDGLVVSFGSVECILTRSSKNSTIDVCLRGKLDDLPELWKLVDGLLVDLMKVLKKYNGIIKSYHIICSHCELIGISPPNHWLPKHAFPLPGAKVARFMMCPKGGFKDIPAALIVNIFKGDITKEKETAAINDVAVYLQNNWKSKKPPQQLLFLDCEEIQSQEYCVTWGLPNVESGGVPITNVVVEVKAATDSSWKCITNPVMGNTYTYTGVAVEFQVAAQNKYGIGKYMSCVPVCDVSDELLLPSDKSAMKQNKETFAQMACVEKIVLRLSSRLVISQGAEERVIRCLNDLKAPQAARLLLEEIFRCNYKQLFLFKKTLKDFGQENLAALIPVRKRNDPVFSEESYDKHQNTGDSPILVYRRQDPGPEQRPHTAAIQTDTVPCVQDDTDTNISVATHQTEVANNLLYPQNPQGQADDLQQPVAPLLQYTLLEELNDQQKRCCPEEHLFAKIVSCLQHIKVLGGNLRFSLDEIKEFIKNEPTSVPSQALEMLVTWKQKNGDRATVRRLVKALQDSNIPEECYREAVLEYFRDSDTDSDDGSHAVGDNMFNYAQYAGLLLCVVIALLAIVLFKLL